MTDTLHELALNYRTALSYPESVRAYKALEDYESALMNTMAALTRSNLRHTAREAMGEEPATWRLEGIEETTKLAITTALQCQRIGLDYEREQLIEAGQKQHEAIDWLMACLIDVTHKTEDPFLPSKSPIWPTIISAHEVFKVAKEKLDET